MRRARHEPHTRTYFLIYNGLLINCLPCLFFAIPVFHPIPFFSVFVYLFLLLRPGNHNQQRMHRATWEPATRDTCLTYHGALLVGSRVALAIASHLLSQVKEYTEEIDSSAVRIRENRSFSSKLQEVKEIDETSHEYENLFNFPAYQPQRRTGVLMAPAPYHNAKVRDLSVQIANKRDECTLLNMKTSLRRQVARKPLPPREHRPHVSSRGALLFVVTALTMRREKRKEARCYFHCNFNEPLQHLTKRVQFFIVFLSLCAACYLST